MPRFRVRTLMIVVAVLALLMGSVGPGRQWYRRWSYHRSQAAVYGRLEQRERSRTDQEAKLASDREAIRTTMTRSAEFAGKSSGELERAVNNAVNFHQYLSKQVAAGGGGLGREATAGRNRGIMVLGSVRTGRALETKTE